MKGVAASWSPMIAQGLSSGLRPGFQIGLKDRQIERVTGTMNNGNGAVCVWKPFLLPLQGHQNFAPDPGLKPWAMVCGLVAQPFPFLVSPSLFLSIFILFFLSAVPAHAQSKNFSAALNRAATSFNAGKLDEAEKQINAADKISPKHPEVPNMRGAIYLKQKKYDEAQEQFNQALSLDPKFDPARLNLAELELLRGNYPLAEQRFSDLQKTDPDSEVLQFKIILCAVLAGEDQKANDLVSTMNFPGKTPAYYYARAAIALKRGDKANANTYFTNLRKYYTEADSAYFVESLKDVGFLVKEAKQ
jgi:Tfp pilus assembly protein PilF